MLRHSYSKPPLFRLTFTALNALYVGSCTPTPDRANAVTHGSTTYSWGNVRYAVLACWFSVFSECEGRLPHRTGLTQ